VQAGGSCARTSRWASPSAPRVSWCAPHRIGRAGPAPLPRAAVLLRPFPFHRDVLLAERRGASAQVFLHEPSGAQFACPQHNGDLFAFTNEVRTPQHWHGILRNVIPRLVRFPQLNRHVLRLGACAWVKRALKRSLQTHARER
jgi:hypothetical protein